MTILSFRVDSKGRVALPRAARELARVEPNSRLVGRVERGRIVLETVELVQHRVWANAAPASGAAVTVVMDQPEMETASLSARERPVGGPAVDEVGEELLAELGL
ncbi:MAG: AbrB/MazE/SpoVT family DNA-binding domain-containing protein [Actinomycetes bacterium]